MSLPRMKSILWMELMPSERPPVKCKCFSFKYKGLLKQKFTLPDRFPPLHPTHKPPSLRCTAIFFFSSFYLFIISIFSCSLILFGLLTCHPLKQMTSALLGASRERGRGYPERFREHSFTKEGEGRPSSTSSGRNVCAFWWHPQRCWHGTRVAATEKGITSGQCWIHWVSIFLCRIPHQVGRGGKKHFRGIR